MRISISASTFCGTENTLLLRAGVSCPLMLSLLTVINSKLQRSTFAPTSRPQTVIGSTISSISELIRIRLEDNSFVEKCLINVSLLGDALLIFMPVLLDNNDCNKALYLTATRGFCVERNSRSRSLSFAAINKWLKSRSVVVKGVSRWMSHSSLDFSLIPTDAANIPVAHRAQSSLIFWGIVPRKLPFLKAIA